MLIDWCSYEVAEPYFTIALPSIRHENELLIRRENKLHRTRDCTMALPLGNAGDQVPSIEINYRKIEIAEF